MSNILVQIEIKNVDLDNPRVVQGLNDLCKDTSNKESIRCAYFPLWIFDRERVGEVKWSKN